MPTELNEREWELVNPDGTSRVFGSLASGHPLVEPYEPGTREVESELTSRPRTDGVAFPPWYYQGGTLDFELLTIIRHGPDRHRRVVEEHRKLSKAWRADDVRKTHQGVSMLRTKVAGVTYVTFGRPAAFASAPARWDRTGLKGATLQFQRADFTWYSDTTRQAQVDLIPPQVGGFTFPVVFPLKMSTTNEAFADAVTVGGDVETFVHARIDGPLTNPFFEFTGLWRAHLDEVTIPEGQYLIIDTNPWQQRVLLNDTVNLAGRLSGVRLSKMAVPPGTYQFVLGGKDNTGTSTATVTLRDAWSEV